MFQVLQGIENWKIAQIPLKSLLDQTLVQEHGESKLHKPSTAPEDPALISSVSNAEVHKLHEFNALCRTCSLQVQRLNDLIRQRDNEISILVAKLKQEKERRFSNSQSATNALALTETRFQVYSPSHEGFTSPYRCIQDRTSKACFATSSVAHFGRFSAVSAVSSGKFFQIMGENQVSIRYLQLFHALEENKSRLKVLVSETKELGELVNKRKCVFFAEIFCKS